MTKGRNDKVGKFYNVLYEAYQRRRMPPNVEADFSDTIHFVIYAAASGIVGNATYEALKAAISAIGRRQGKRRDYRPLLLEVVPPELYEQHRLSTTRDDPSRIPTDELVAELEWRHSTFEPHIYEND